MAEANNAPPKAQVEPAPLPAKKGGHRRGNSLSGLLPMLLPKRSPSLPGKLPPEAGAAATQVHLKSYLMHSVLPLLLVLPACNKTLQSDSLDAANDPPCFWVLLSP